LLDLTDLRQVFRIIGTESINRPLPPPSAPVCIHGWPIAYILDCPLYRVKQGAVLGLDSRLTLGP